MYLGDLGRHGGTLGDILGAIGCHLEAIESHLGTIGDDLGGLGVHWGAPNGPISGTRLQFSLPFGHFVADIGDKAATPS